MAERETNEEITTMNRNLVAATAMPIGRTGPLRRPVLLLAGALAALALLFATNSGSARADGSQIFIFHSYPSTTQAGGHPDLYTEFELGSRISTVPPVPCYCNDPKEVTVHSPAGVTANPHVVAECKIAQLAQGECSADSQAGQVMIKLFGGYILLAMYRTPPATGQAGQFAFTLPFGSKIPQFLVVHARTESDYGLDVTAEGISHLLPLEYTAPIFWGVPGEHFYDFLRIAPSEASSENGGSIQCSQNPIPALLAKSEADLIAACSQFGWTVRDNPSSLPIAPMMQNPTTCVGPLKSSIDVLAYDLGRTSAEDDWPATTGCDGLSFDPSLAANPTTTNTDSPSGVEVVIDAPQFQDPSTPSPSELKASLMTLPEGFSLNPSAAAGKLTCSDLQSSVGTAEEAHCPEFSKVGTVTIDTSALPAPINGFAYLGEPKPGEPYRLVVSANGFGVAVKLLGTVHADEKTGQLVAGFSDLPQTPFQKFTIHFFGAERGLLATPTHCGQYPVTSEFTPWDGALSIQKQTQFFVLDHGPNATACPGATRDFKPGFEAGTKSNAAGAHTTFSLRIAREDGEQNLDALSLSTAPGFLAKLRGVPYCPESAIAELGSSDRNGREELADPACPAASEVGSAAAAAGAGTKPLYTSGKAYLAGPYKGAPLSLVVVVPAVAGPYDLGNVVTRAALNIDPATLQVSAVSDPLPRVVEGVPLRLRLIQVELDRPNFALNPTNCEPFSVDAAITGDQGSVANVSAPFQVANCTDLEYGPKLSLKLKGGLNRLGHPAIRAVLRTKQGEANSRHVSVTLPAGELLDNKHIGTVCTRGQFAADSCPAESLLGSATAWSQLLDQPLSGSVYLRASSHRLPDLVTDLEGQVDVELSARIDTAKGGRLRATFGSIPDVPVEKFVMNLEGGKKGLLQNSRGLCGKHKRAKVQMTGQNGWRLTDKVPLGISCGSKAKHRRNARHHRRRMTSAGAVR
jgi:hypothetical protein